MEKQKKPIYKKWWFWVLIVLLIPILNPNKKQSSPDVTPAPEASVEATTEDIQEPQTTEDKITAIIDSLNFKYSDLKIYDNGSSVKISLHYDEEAWDVTRLCSNCLTDYINLCKQAYEIEGIDKIEYFAFVNMIDPKGNEISEKGFAICMAKANYSTYTWDNLKFVEGSYDQIESDCEFLDIHAGIKKDVDFSKVYYKG